MLPKRSRLSRREFVHVLKTGTRVHTEHLTLTHAPGGTLKCGVVVSKKVARHAVKRNLVRRRIYALCSTWRERLGPVHLVVHTKKGVEQVPFPALEEEFARGIERFLMRR